MGARLESSARLGKGNLGLEPVKAIGEKCHRDEMPIRYNNLWDLCKGSTRFIP